MEQAKSRIVLSGIAFKWSGYYSEIPNGPDCDRSVEILQISYDVSLGKIVMSKWAGTNGYREFPVPIVTEHYDDPDFIFLIQLNPITAGIRHLVLDLTYKCFRFKAFNRFTK